MTADMSMKKLGSAFLGTRFEGRTLRLELERHLRESERVRLDFAGVAITQSCADEFVGVLIAQEGQSLLDRLVFAHCSPTARAILEFVIGTRMQDNARLVRAGRKYEGPLEGRIAAG